MNRTAVRSPAALRPGAQRAHEAAQALRLDGTGPVSAPFELGAHDETIGVRLKGRALPAARFNLRGRFIRVWPDVPGESRAGDSAILASFL